MHEQNVIDEHQRHKLNHMYGVKEHSHHHDHDMDDHDEQQKRQSMRLHAQHHSSKRSSHHGSHHDHGKVHYFKKTIKLSKLLERSLSDISHHDHKSPTEHHDHHPPIIDLSSSSSSLSEDEIFKNSKHSDDKN